MAVRSFQKDRGLKNDGLLNPGGPTLRALQSNYGFTNAARALQAALPRLGGEAFSSNARNVKALLKTYNYGDMPKYMADAWNAHTKGKAEVTDLLGQLWDASPKAAKTLRKQLAAKIDPSKRGLLFASSVLRDLADKGDGGDKKPPKEPGKPKELPKDPGKPDPDKEKICKELEGRLYVAQTNQEKYSDAVDTHRLANDRIPIKWKVFVDTAGKFSAGWAVAFLRKKGLKRGPLPSEVLQAWQDYQDAKENARMALDELNMAKNNVDIHEKKWDEVKDKMDEAGCK